MCLCYYVWIYLSIYFCFIALFSFTLHSIISLILFLYNKREIPKMEISLCMYGDLYLFNKTLNNLECRTQSGCLRLIIASSDKHSIFCKGISL